MTPVPRVCSRCRISSREDANKALRISCGQMRIKQQQMKAREMGRWKLHGSTTVLLLWASSSSKQTESRWTWEQDLLSTLSSAAPLQGDGREKIHQPPCPGKDCLFSPGGTGRVSARWTSPCPHKTSFCFVLWLGNQSLGTSTGSWQQRSSSLFQYSLSRKVSQEDTNFNI